MKKIRFSDHSLFKIEILKKHGVIIEKSFVKEVILSPDKTEEGYKGRIIAQKRLDKTHILRVVYESYPEEIAVITLYPVRRKRYEKD